jgi:hypothetical protein
MPRTWITALSRYSYPVRLSDYKRADEFPGFFTRDIPGDRASTIEFEDYFRATSPHGVEPYIEVAFWKLCGKKKRFEARVNDLADHLRGQGVTAAELRCAVDLFVAKPTRVHLSVMRALLGVKAPVLALALTYPAFVDPDQFPMVDTNTARWVCENAEMCSRSAAKKLTRFEGGRSSVQDNDFENYLNWVYWCRETAEILTARTDTPWRARDVEMAVFTAAREGLSLNPLPQCSTEAV